MARTPDLERRQELLDHIVDHLAEHGLAQATLRPLAAALGVSINRLVHHFGTKEELIATALRRAVERQTAVERGWIQRDPSISMADLYRKWWKWMNAKPENLALVRLGYEAAALDTTVTGLPGDLRADQLAVWRHIVEGKLRQEGLSEATAQSEATIQKAMFTGFILDLVASGDRKRLGAALEVSLRRLEALIDEVNASTKPSV
ncbi:MAG: TetR/AcrR family transcriptional regulator [Actinomycetota bacterium]